MDKFDFLEKNTKFKVVDGTEIKLKMNRDQDIRKTSFYLKRLTNCYIFFWT